MKKRIRTKAYWVAYRKKWEKRANRWANPKRRAWVKKWYSDNPLKGVEYRRMADYGISPKEYNSMASKQKNLCALCGCKERRRYYKTNKPFTLSVDHDHKTGKIRALLCGDCNRALGLFQENIELLLKAARYLRKHRKGNQ